MGTICSSTESQVTRIITPNTETRPSRDQRLSEDERISMSHTFHENVSRRHLSTPRTFEREILDSAVSDVPQQTIFDPEDVQLSVLGSLPPYIARRLSGRLQEKEEEILCDKVIRVYHIADNTDSLEEREVLLEGVYPKFRTLCLENGYDLDVIDLHWGHRDPYLTFREGGVSPCDQLKRLLEADRQTLVVVFLNEKYGSYGVPATIPEEHMLSITNSLSENEKEFLLSWYQKDENMVPPCYILQPMNEKIIKFGSSSEREQEEACEEWSETEAKLSGIIWQNSDKNFQKSHLISSLEAELTESVLDDMFPPDNALLIRRYFSKFDPISISSNTLKQYTDIIQGKPDEIAQTKLNNLTNNLNNKIKPTNKIELEVSWHEGSFNAQDIKHTSYFKQLCSKYEKMLQVALEKIMDVKIVYERIRVNMMGAGMVRNLYDEVVQNTNMCQMLMRDFISRDDVFDFLKNYVINGHPMASSEHVRPLVVAGESGVGKSTLVAELVRRSCTFRGWTKSLCIIRHIDAEPGCTSIDQTVASIASQICFLYDMPYEYAHRPVSMYPYAFSQLLHRITLATPLVIVIDGIDRVRQSPDMAWLPEELPLHIRIVITVTNGTKIHGKLKNMTWQTEDYLINVPNMDADEAITLVKNDLKKNNRELTKPQMELVESTIKTNPNPLFAKLIACQVIHWNSYRLKGQHVLGSSIRESIGDILSHLQTDLEDESLGRLLNYLTLLGTGVTDMEMIDLLSTDEGVLLPVFSHAEPRIRRAPDYIWYNIKTFLQPQLLTLTSDGLKLTMWRHQVVGNAIRDICQGFETATWMKLLDYFEGRWSLGKKMPYSSKDQGIDLLRDRLVKPQPLKFGESYNRRKLVNIAECLLQNDMARTLKEVYLLNRENLTHMLRSCGVYQVLHDFDLYLSFEPNDKEILFMYDHLRQVTSLVHQSSDHLWSQMFLRAKAGILKTEGHPNIHKIVDSLSKVSLEDLCPPFLLPSNMRIFKAEQQTNIKTKSLITGLYSIPGDPNHMVSVAPDKGKITVWNIHHQVAVRALTNLQEPKDIKMIDSRRAVILCNRELIIYDLDEGKEVRRLKGVLNIKMPFYGALDEEHTVALSRNRMYVNIIKNSTGDIDATFKVGEDRFLDSLILSGNGEWCVCGDQVQKPFPLLVWDMVNRRLVHDLRISGHEFVTRMAAITTEGHYIVCVSRLTETETESLSTPLSHYSIIEQAVSKAKYLKEKPREPNFLIVYDLQSGSLFKKWKPDFDTTSVAISSASGLVLSGHEDGSLLAWDLVGGAQRHKLTGHSRGPDYIDLSEDGERAVSCDLTGKDSSVRLWDLVHGVSLGSFASDYGVTCCKLSTDGSVVVIGLPGHTNIISLWANEEAKNKSKLDISIYGDASRNKETFIMEDQ